MRRFLIMLVMALILPVAIWAQAGDDLAGDLANEGDKGFITRFLQEKLSGAGREVRIDGFRGALSSRATFEQMTIADDEGVWITLKDGAIQWTRAALLRGRIEVGELNAAEILLPRLPGGGADTKSGPRTEARDFALPELPVAVHINQINAERVELGEPVIGLPASLSLSGTMNLEAGEGNALLSIRRLDGPRGEFALDTGFDNDSRNLRLSLLLDEAKDGLLVNLIDLYGSPSVNAEITGNGPLSDFAADIRLSTDGQPRVTGQVSAMAEPRKGAPGNAFRLALDGDVASLLAPEDRAFFGNQTQLSAQGWRGEDGQLELPDLSITTEALTLKGALALSAQGAPEAARLDLDVSDDQGIVQLPFADQVTVQGGRLRLDFDAAQDSGWVLNGALKGVNTQGTHISTLALDGKGRVAQQDDRLESITGTIDFGAQGLALHDAGLARAIGQDVTGSTTLDFTPGNAVELGDLHLNGTDYGLKGDVLIAGLSGGITISADMDARYDDLTRLSTMAGRPLSGRAEGHMQGHYTVLSKAFYADTELTGHDITADQPQLDRMLRGRSQITAVARRDLDGLTLDELTLNAQNLTAEAKGYLNSDRTHVTAQIEMPDLSVADPDYAGAARFQAVLDGPNGSRSLNIEGNAQDLHIGMAEIDGLLGGDTRLSIVAAEQAGAYTLRRFDLTNPQLRANGQGSFADGQIDAEMDATLPRLTALGNSWGGALSLNAGVFDEDGTRHFAMTGTGKDLRIGALKGVDLLPGETQLQMAAEQKDGMIALHQLDIDNAQLALTAEGMLGKGAADVTAQGRLASLAPFGPGWRGAVEATAHLHQAEGKRQFDIDATGRDLALGQTQLDGALRGETRLALAGIERDGVITLERAQVDNPRLTARASGQIGGAATDLAAQVSAGDLRFLGNGLSGALTADGRLLQQGDQRRITANGTATGLSVGQPKLDPLLAGQTRFSVAATQDSGGLTLQDLSVQNPQLRVAAQGNPTAGLNVDASLSNLGLLQPGLAGPAQVTGTLREDGPNYAANLSATAPGGTRAQISGRAARDFSDTDLRISGISDASLANAFMRTRSVEGPLSFDLTMRGRPALEALSGRIQLTNGRVADPRLGVRLEEVGVAADLQGGTITVDGAANVAAGGRLRVNGPVDPIAGRLDIRALLDGVVARDPNLYEVTLDGDVRISGMLADGPQVSGRIDVREAEIRIPSTGLGGAKAIPDITHIGAERPPVRRTRAKAGLLAWPSAEAVAAGMTAPPSTLPPNPARLDLLIDAPNQVFIRGRGVDAEMGGQLQLRGTARQVIPIGTLSLIRGRVDLLGKRFVLDEGLVELQGSMIPVLRLVATTSQNLITTRIIIDGEAQDPDITFESTPELPEEEVLSQLLFGRGLDNISALQAAQLANAVAVLAGRGGIGIVGNLREQTGLDDLDLATDDAGNVQLRAGKYLTDNVYTDVSVSDDGKSQINLNLDITDTLRARGSVDNQGESTLGLYFEKDY